MSQPSSAEWYTEWFDSDYLLLYSGRDEEEAARNSSALLSLIEGSGPACVLDIACGNGRYSELAADAGHHALGLDYSKALLEVARSNSTKAEYVRGDMRCLPFRENSIDVVWSLFNSFGYFESDEEHRQMLVNWRRSMKPGAQLVINYFNRPFLLKNLVRDSTETRNDTVFRIRRSFSPDSLRVIKEISIEKPGGVKRLIKESVRLYTSRELAGLVASAGYSITQTFGGFGKTPLRDEDREILLVAKAISHGER